MNKFRLLNIEHKDPCMNLAIEEAIAMEVGSGKSSPTLRLWRNVNAVVIGRFQRADFEVDLAECEKHHVSVTRRFTGGGAVYHDEGNLNCAVSMPRDHPVIGKTVSTPYEILGASLVSVLESLGLRACINSNSVYIDGKKISGMAGAMDWGVVFQHCTFLVNTNVDIMSKVLKPANGNASKRYVHSKRQEVTTLNAQLGRDVSVSEMGPLFAKAFGAVWGVELIEGDLRSDEKLLAQELYEKKYLNGEYAVHIVNT